MLASLSSLSPKDGNPLLLLAVVAGLMDTEAVGGINVEVKSS